MKAKSGILGFFMAIIFFCSTAYGETGDIVGGMGKKFFRGLINVFTGWTELPAQTIKGYNRSVYEGNAVVGTIFGFFRGITYTIGRTASGALELVGFWTANPENNWEIGVPLDAEYAWQQGSSYDYFSPDFEKATLRPMGRKFLRGLQNTLFGFAELPGQLAKGFSEGTLDYGIMKGLWFVCSREVCGVTDLATAILPSPEENLGYPFDEKYPWGALADSTSVLTTKQKD